MLTVVVSGETEGLAVPGSSPGRRLRAKPGSAPGDGLATAYYRECNGRAPELFSRREDQEDEMSDTATMVALGEDYPELRESVRKICERYPGSYWVNNGKTKINYISVQTHVHPGDDNVGVQACIVGKVQELIGVPVTAKRKLN